MTNEPEITSAEKVKLKVPRHLQAKFLILQYLSSGRHKVRAARIKRWKRRIQPPKRHIGAIEDQNTLHGLKTRDFTKWVEPKFTEAT